MSVDSACFRAGGGTATTRESGVPNRTSGAKLPRSKAATNPPLAPPPRHNARARRSKLRRTSRASMRAAWVARRAIRPLKSRRKAKATTNRKCRRVARGTRDRRGSHCPPGDRARSDGIDWTRTTWRSRRATAHSRESRRPRRPSVRARGAPAHPRAAAKGAAPPAHRKRGAGADAARERGIGDGVKKGAGGVFGKERRSARAATHGWASGRGGGRWSGVARARLQ